MLTFFFKYKYLPCPPTMNMELTHLHMELKKICGNFDVTKRYGFRASM